jgi:hypothetical protein
MATITHTKTDTIPDWTQADLDAEIAEGNYPPGTLLADIVLPSDWNADHTIVLGADENFVTDAQVTLINNAVQPGALATVATTGDYDDLINKPTIPTQYTNEMAQDAVGGIVNDTLLYDDGAPSIGINLNKANIWTADQSVPDEAYGVGWNGSVEVPTKNALYDKIESLSPGGSVAKYLTNTGNTFDPTGTAAAPHQLFLKTDGSIMYILNYTGSPYSIIYQFTVGTPWNVSTASYASKSFNPTAQEDLATAFFIKPDGTKLYLAGETNSTIYQYTLSTPWDISTASYDSVSFAILGTNYLTFSSDGSRLLVTDSGGIIYSYTLGTPWNLATATFTVSFNSAILDNNGYPVGTIILNTLGSSAMMVFASSPFIYQLALPSANNIGTINVMGMSTNFYPADGQPLPITSSFADSSFAHFVALDEDNVLITEYTLT